MHGNINIDLFFIFRQEDSSQESLSSWMSYLSQQASAYLPAQMNDLMFREKAVAFARLPMTHQKTIVAMPRLNLNKFIQYMF